MEPASWLLLDHLMCHHLMWLLWHNQLWPKAGAFEGLWGLLAQVELAGAFGGPPSPEQRRRMCPRRAGNGPPTRSLRSTWVATCHWPESPDDGGARETEVVAVAPGELGAVYEVFCLKRYYRGWFAQRLTLSVCHMRTRTMCVFSQMVGLQKCAYRRRANFCKPLFLTPTHWYLTQTFLSMQSCPFQNETTPYELLAFGVQEA